LVDSHWVIIMIFRLIFLALFFSSAAFALSSLPFRSAAVAEDIQAILKEAKLPEDTLSFRYLGPGPSQLTFFCMGDKIEMRFTAPADEESSTLYKGIKELGFLFPHPLKQISPSLISMKKNCGRRINWRPALKYRGSHLHTLHPSEWVHGFYMNRPEVALASVRWLARNGQNLLDVSLLRVPVAELKRQFTPPFNLARSLQVHTGASLGVALQQQKSYKLLSIWQTFFGDAREQIRTGLAEIIEALPLSFIVLEAGTSEFTPTDYDKSLEWLNFAGKVVEEKGLSLFTKVHVSSNQHHKKWGNFNFLPRYADKSVGILPHTVMFYGLLDKRAPMYDNKDFSAIRLFMEKEMEKRPTWYYPETSYWVGMDIDIPLFLTDYLFTRAEDTRWLYESRAQGQLNFTTGHALGGWLLDWNLALINDLDHKFDPLTGPKLLGEDAAIWKSILEHQHHWFKKEGLIAPLSAANLQDELTTTHRIHARTTLKELSEKPLVLAREIVLLQKALDSIPTFVGVKDKELKALLEITYQRLQHALALRQALSDPMKRSFYLTKAKELRENSLKLIKEMRSLETNYPTLPLFEKHSNPTSYQFGYVWSAATLHFWEREERQVEKDRYFPFENNIYDLWNILF
jgi:hypothetical protein